MDCCFGCILMHSTEFQIPLNCLLWADKSRRQHFSDRIWCLIFCLRGKLNSIHNEAAEQW